MVGQAILNGLGSGCLVGILAVGFALARRGGLGFHFAHAGVFAVGAMTFQATLECWGLTTPAAACLAIIASAVTGLTLQCLVYEPLLFTRASETSMFVSSLAAYIVIQGVLSLFFGDASRVVGPWRASGSYEFLAVRATPTQVLSVAIGIGLCLVAAVWSKTTKNGKALRATGQDMRLAAVVGIGVRRVRSLAIVAGSVLAALAGILTAGDTGVFPTMGLMPFLSAVVAALIGGGGLPGVFVAAATIGVVQHMSVLWIPTIWQESLVFLVLAVYLIVRRSVSGLSGLGALDA